MSEFSLKPERAPPFWINMNQMTLDRYRLKLESEASALRAEVERLRVSEETCNQEANAAYRHLAAANALLERGMPLLEQWRTTDITSDDDTWADFTNAMHRWHDRIVAHLSGQALARTNHLEEHLAAANALLRRVPRWTVPADTVKPDRFQQAGLDLTRDIDAHLSGQAPERKK